MFVSRQTCPLSTLEKRETAYQRQEHATSHCFMSFLNNAENKTQMFKLMLNAWQSEKASRNIHGHSVYLLVDGHGHPRFRRWISCSFPTTLRWRHNGLDSVSNHQPPGCLLNRLFRRKSKKTSKLRVTGLCAGNSPGTGEFSAQMASYAENVSIWWRHHEEYAMHSNQEQTDTCVIVYIKWTQDHG